MSKPRETAVYTHGHHESVLRSHTWRTAANSAAYLLGSLQPHMRILDVGCGPGTITADLAALVPDGHVTGVDRAPGILEQAGDTAAGRGLANVEFASRTCTPWTSRTTRSASSTPTRCCSTSVIRWPPCARCDG
ncbi:hypothetical protein GCM10022233_30740 [Streptomyces shaanxiensis]|uniref:Methyltransferase domain-containing protein n=1 Tax=Streptomyces shaanxiensis TaxID=653357 RepID=A0ABP7UZY1_9ACTN